MKIRGKTRDRSAGMESPTRVESEDDFLKDKRSPSMFDMLHMYFLSTFARKLVVALVFSFLFVAFFESQAGSTFAWKKPATVSPTIVEPFLKSVSSLDAHLAKVQQEEELDLSRLMVKRSVPVTVPVNVPVTEPVDEIPEPEVRDLDISEEPVKEEPEVTDTTVNEKNHDELEDPEDKADDIINADPTKAKNRWAQLEIPSTCLLPGVLPTGVIAGLELYTEEPTDPPPSPPPTLEAPVAASGEKLAKLVSEEDESIEETLVVKPLTHKPRKPIKIVEETEEEPEAVEESTEAADPVEGSEEQPPVEETEAEEAVVEVAEEQESPAETAIQVEEEVDEKDEEVSPVEEESAAVEDPVGEEETSHEEGGKGVEEGEEDEGGEGGEGGGEEEVGSRHLLQRVGGRRLLAGSTSSRRDRGPGTRVVIQREVPAVVPAVTLKVPQQQGGAVRRNAVITKDTTHGTYNTLNLMASVKARFHQVEVEVLSSIRNITAYESHCQFASRECAQESARELANLLRLNAQAVSDADSIGTISHEMQRVSQNLAQLRSNTRMTMNQTALESLGDYGSLGKCAVVGRGEFDDSGNRFDTQVSRFAQVIDSHDTMVYCSNKAHKCIFSSLNEPNVKKVEVDYKSWMSAFEVGKKVHSLLSEEPELGGGVLGWGHTGDPTITFTNFIVLLRSGLCERIDIYGETERPSHWLKVVGNGHLVSQPGPAHKDWELAVALQQERFTYRLVSNAMGGKMCFFQ